jgi:transposase
MGTRKQYSATMKVKIVLEILKEEKSIPQIASPYGINPSILNRWKNAAVEKLPSLFADDTKRRDYTKAEYEKNIQDLYTEIGRLTTELAWLKKEWLLSSVKTSAWIWWNGITWNRVPLLRFQAHHR